MQKQYLNSSGHLLQLSGITWGIFIAAILSMLGPAMTTQIFLICLAAAGFIIRQKEQEALDIANKDAGYHISLTGLKILVFALAILAAFLIPWTYVYWNTPFWKPAATWHIKVLPVIVASGAFLLAAFQIPASAKRQNPATKKASVPDATA